MLLELETQNVKSVRRFWRKINDAMIPTNSFLLKIEAPRIPTHIRLGFLQVRTRAYCPRPMICHNCGKYGHTKTKCQMSPICINCGTAAHGDCENEKNCLHCNGQHNLLDRNCPNYKIEEEMIKYKTDYQVSYQFEQHKFAAREITFPHTRS